MKHIKRIIPLALVGFFLVLLVRLSGWTDALVQVTSQAAQAANDSVSWSQLGPDGTLLTTTSFNADSGGGLVTGTLNASNSIVSVACSASPSCSWASGFAGGDTLVWTSDGGNGGTGPLTISFANPVSGAGALIQADGPGQFTVKITAFNGSTTLGSFSQTSDSNGDATYLGVSDSSGANITSVEYQLTSCVGDCTDFAIDTLLLNDSSAGSTPTPSTTPTTSTTPTPTATPTPGPLTFSPKTVTIHATYNAKKGTAKPKTKKVKLINAKKTAGGQDITLGSPTVGTAEFSASANCNGVILAPGKSCKVTVTFTPPTTAATYPDTLTVTSNASNGTQLVPLSGIGKVTGLPK
jgi:hypothetical protein